MPLSETNTIPFGTSARSLKLFLTSTVKFFKFLLFTPMIFAPHSSAICTSSSSCASTSASSLSSFDRSKNLDNALEQLKRSMHLWVKMPCWTVCGKHLRSWQHLWKRGAGVILLMTKALEQSNAKVYRSPEKGGDKKQSVPGA